MGEGRSAGFVVFVSFLVFDLGVGIRLAALGGLAALEGVRVFWAGSFFRERIVLDADWFFDEDLVVRDDFLFLTAVLAVVFWGVVLFLLAAGFVFLLGLGSTEISLSIETSYAALLWANG